MAALARDMARQAVQLKAITKSQLSQSSSLLICLQYKEGVSKYSP